MKNERVLYTFELELSADILSKLNCKSPIEENWDDKMLDLTGNKTQSNIKHSISLIKTELSIPKFIFQIFSEKLLKDVSQQSEKEVEDGKCSLDNSQQTDERNKMSFENLSKQTQFKTHSESHQQIQSKIHSESHQQIQSKTHSESHQQTHSDSIQQTETKDYSDFRQQTDINKNHSACQTTIRESNDSVSQTTILEIISIASNTNESRMKQHDNSTLTDQNLGSFKDAESMVEVDTTDSTCQVVSQVEEKGCQNSPNCNHVLCQTCPLVNTTSMQTDQKEFQSSVIQTASSMSIEVDSSTQAGWETTDKDTQAVWETTDKDTQAVWEMTDKDMQAVWETTDKEMQAATENKSMVTQTYNGCLQSMEEETQAVVLMLCQEAQTETDSKDQDTTTDHNLLSQRSTTTQACLEMVSQSQQTNIHALNFSESTILKQWDREDEQLDTLQLQSHVDSPKLILNSTLDSSVAANTSFLAPLCPHDDAASQTDPVTIIIGDASFLVQKLKSSAVNSSKVTTSGNEIEIELSVDNDAVKNEHTAIQTDKQHHYKKQNRQQLKTPQQKAKTQAVKLLEQQQQQAALNPRVTGGGVRMRMPVTTFNNHPINKKTVVEALYSCPFCSLNFSESPALYQHLSDAHKSDTKAKWRKSHGREGKTIIPRNNATPKSGKKKGEGEVQKRKISQGVDATSKMPKLDGEEKTAVKY